MSRQICTTFYFFLQCFHIIIWEKFWAHCKREEVHKYLSQSSVQVLHHYLQISRTTMSVFFVTSLPFFCGHRVFCSNIRAHTCYACLLLCDIKQCLLTFALVLLDKSYNSAELQKDVSRRQFWILWHSSIADTKQTSHLVTQRDPVMFYPFWAGGPTRSLHPWNNQFIHRINCPKNARNMMSGCPIFRDIVSTTKPGDPTSYLLHIQRVYVYITFPLLRSTCKL